MQRASASCPTCETLYTDLPVELDECDMYAVLEVIPCRACGALLCESCARFACDGCGECFCREHQVVVPDGGKGLACCAACAAECEPLELPIGPARELCCPQCLGVEFTIATFDYGVCEETGYHDTGESFTCACGATGEANDLLVAAPRKREPQRETRPAAAKENAA
jgi:hypothetical protein